MPSVSYLDYVKNLIQLVHISTDYVFDGKKGSPYYESDFTEPLNNYGLSKLQGEKAVMNYNLKIPQSLELPFVLRQWQ